MANNKIIDYEPAFSLFKQQMANEREYLWRYTHGLDTRSFLKDHPDFQIPASINPRLQFILAMPLSVNTQIVDDIADLPGVERVYVKLTETELWLNLLIKPGFTPEQIEAELTPISQRYQ